MRNLQTGQAERQRPACLFHPPQPVWGIVRGRATVSLQSPANLRDSTCITCHVSYTAAQKLSIVKEAKQTSNSAIAQKYNIDRKMIRQWIKDEEDIVEMEE